MANCKFTNKAVEDLSKIWDYTLKTWSEKQADKYYETLISTCQEIAYNPKLGNNYDGIYHDLFGMKSGKHIIFYRMGSGDYVEITRILHERMDLSKRVSEQNIFDEGEQEEISTIKDFLIVEKRS